MLEAIELTKIYPDGLTALDAVSFRVTSGDLFCLAGANGAGKTTAISCFLDFISPSSGRVEVDGIHVARNPIEAKRRVAYVSENVALYGALTARQNLRFFAHLGENRERVSRRELEETMHAVRLPVAVLDRRVESFSKGMRQKVGLAIALLRGANNLILDEPTSGLDPQSGAEFMDLLARLRDAGAAIVMSTHDLFRAKSHADRLGLMRQGRLYVTLSRDEIASSDAEDLYAASAREPAGRAAPT
jgi:ABC-2 type transport system ATP-binding protein